MSAPDPLADVTFSDVPPPPDDDAPDYLASDDSPPAGTSPPTGGELPRKRRLPGRGGFTGFGSKDNSSRTERGRAAPKVSKPLPPIPVKGFAPGVEKMYEALALAVTPFDVKLGELLHEVAPEAAIAWDELARQNHAVRRLLVYLMETTAWGQLAAAHSPLFGLMFARMMGKEPRVSMAAMMMGKEAENFLRPDGNGESNRAA